MDRRDGVPNGVVADRSPVGFPVARESLHNAGKRVAIGGACFLVFEVVDCLRGSDLNRVVR